jgi:nitroreductase
VDIGGLGKVSPVQTWEAITSRRNVREYATRPIAADSLNRLLEAGRRSPSSQNWQPWDFVVVTDHDELIKLAGVWRGAGHVAGSAATIALITDVPENDMLRARQNYDLGQATMSIMIAAADLGIGSGHSSVGDQDLARELLGFPDNKRCAYLIALGYPAGRALAPINTPDRRPFDEVVHFGRW